ncbi:hypothetical protein [Thalassomonas actiniarum]|uniref:Uncharacterized protein n=1 Tax=Thalassomonas actiniarum TaxID=485447 RepID=A0AAE9YRB8_9GAMM|nr:hypothetical protein [Thalassomonas actiniarum]WDD99660.1 hypothetical protein SG35_003025 [Thalassomonas actiniarum]
MLKWLTSLLVVIFGFMVILLALGYLLKENEAQTTALKQELDQQRARALKEKALKEQARKANGQREMFVLEPYEEVNQQEAVDDRLAETEDKAYKNTPIFASMARVAREHSSCESDQQCLLFNLDHKGAGCWLSVNTQGAAILAKISALHPGGVGADTPDICLAGKDIKAVCRDYHCREQVVNPAL